MQVWTFTGEVFGNMSESPARSETHVVNRQVASPWLCRTIFLLKLSLPRRLYIYFRPNFRCHKSHSIGNESAECNAELGCAIQD